MAFEDDPYWSARMSLSSDDMRNLRDEAEQKAREAYDATTRAMASAGGGVRGLASDAEGSFDRFKAGVQAQMDRLIGQRAPSPAPSPNLPLRGMIYPSAPDPAAPADDAWQVPAAPHAGRQVCALTWPVDPRFSDINQHKGHQGDGRYSDGVTSVLRHNDDGTARKHAGMDITAPINTPVHAADAGVVMRNDAADSKGYGLQVVVDHGDGLATRYAHLNPSSTNHLKVGDAVTRGQQIGAVGTSGNPLPPSKGGDPHLHFGILQNGVAVPPNGYLCPPGVFPAPWD